MDTAALDYHLPTQLIAQHGLPDRAASRLLVLDRDSPPGRVEHRHFPDLLDYLTPGDCLVINQTKVIPARFFARRTTGGHIEGLFLTLDQQSHWQVLLKNASRLRPGEHLTLIPPPHRSADHPDPPLTLTVTANQGHGTWLLKPDFPDDHLHILTEYGTTPLPPYISRSPGDPADQTDRQRYQTVYANSYGSVAAPTAGLHFTDDLLARIAAHKVAIARLTLHVGLATFRPITTDRLEDHPMHAEQYHLDQANADLINNTTAHNRRVIAVGTTSVRVLETLAKNRRVAPASGSTNIFITPGYQFKIVDAIVTNFHLPRSTLLALVCAFAGTDRTLTAYRLAVEQKYRFYSYGDAMLLL